MPGDNCFFQVSIRCTLGLALLCWSVRDLKSVAALTSEYRGMRSFLVRPKEWMMSTPPTNMWVPESAILILVMYLSVALGSGNSSSLYPDVHSAQADGHLDERVGDRGSG